MPRFRETIWFKRGSEVAPAEEPDAIEGDAERPLEDRYGDDGSLSMIDHAAFSVRTGGTQMLPSFPDVTVGDPDAADETMHVLVGQMHQGRATVIAMLGASAIAVAAVVAFAIL